MSPERFLYLINELQLLFHIPLLKLGIPGNVLVVFTNLIDLTNYDLLKHLRWVSFSSSIQDAKDLHHIYFNGY